MPSRPFMRISQTPPLEVLDVWLPEPIQSAGLDEIDDASETRADVGRESGQGISHIFIDKLNRPSHQRSYQFCNIAVPSPFNNSNKSRQSDDRELRRSQPSP